MSFFFPFSSKIPYAYFPKRLNTKKKKKLHQMCYCEVRNIANKVYDVQNNAKQNSRDVVKKVLVIKLDPPKISTNRRAWFLTYYTSFQLLG